MGWKGYCKVDSVDPNCGLFFPFFHVCVCTCMWVLHVHVYTCTWRVNVDTGIILTLISTLIHQGRVSQLNLELTDIARLPSHLALRIPGSTSQGWITRRAAHLTDICACWQYKLRSSHLRDKSLTVDVFKGIEAVTQTPQEHKSHLCSLLGLVAKDHNLYLVAPLQREKTEDRIWKNEILALFLRQLPHINHCGRRTWTAFLSTHNDPRTY